jgi:hypothetical protein
MPRNGKRSQKMTIGRSIADYKESERLYVIEGKSLREIATIMGLKSNSSVSTVARREDWKGKRQAYLSSIARRSYETAAATVASEQNAIRDEAVLAGRATIRTYLTKLAAGEITVSAKDALVWAQFLVAEMTAGPGMSTEAPDARNVTPPDAELLRRVVDAARERVAPSGGVGPTALVFASDARSN